MKNQVAKTILEQLGGNRFIAMTGASSFAGGEFSLSFRIPRTNKIKAVIVTLNGLDLYDMRFVGQKNAPSHEVFDVAVHKNVTFEDLQPLFTKETGLYTHL